MPEHTSTSSKETSRYALDATEREIVKRLAQDGRTPFQSIAKEIGVDEKTVRNRVAKLREKGLLSLIPTANGNNLEGCLVAIVAINIGTDIRNSVEDLAKRIAELPMVSWVGAVLGQYDLIAEVVVESWDDLTRFELQELPAIEGVGKTTSFLVLSHFGKRGVPFVDAVLDSDK
jgi:Lrp/AsnC family transcriptional regulator for asnA, asnC and gidA